MYNYELFETYSSNEALAVATMAEAKGLTLLEGDFINPWGSTGEKGQGYHVVKVIGGNILH